MDYKSLSKKWYERGLSEKDIFVKFLLFYIALEANIKLKFSKIRKLKQDTSIKGRFYEKVCTEDLKKLKVELDKRPLKNMNPDGDQRWDGKLTDPYEFRNVIEFVIRTRNNMFHGDKSPDGNRDEFIVKSGICVLQPLVEVLIND